MFKLKSGESSLDSMGIFDLEIVKLHMPGLLDRRNASISFVQVTPEKIKAAKYEQAQSTEAPRSHTLGDADTDSTKL